LKEKPMYTATYSPEDNKLRLYSLGRLPKELYSQVKAHGFIYAPKQELFVAPMWTPSREDFLLDLCGEIGDEDTSLVDRAEMRSERFEDYSEKRGQEAERAHDYVSGITEHIPLGQPILVGHHSERRARRDAEKIENGMRRAVRLWDTSKYWTQRAAGAIRHAKYKERVDVRARRVKGLEADRRRYERTKADAEKVIALWTSEGELTYERARSITNSHDHIYTCFTLERFPRNPPASQYEGSMSLWSALEGIITPEQARQLSVPAHTRTIQHCDRWVAHIDNRLSYERAMLDASGYVAPVKAKKVELPICNYRAPQIIVPNRWNKGEFMTLPQMEMTRAEYARIYTDHKGTSECENSHRVRIAIIKHDRVAVFITDSKVHPKPEAKERQEPEPRPLPTPEHHVYAEPERTKFDDLKETLKAGIQVVSAPQLFPTPHDLAARMAELAGIRAGDRVLEPSAGTGHLVLAMGDAMPNMVAVELSHRLTTQLQARYPSLDVRQADFLECNGDLGKFDRVVMNPPFVNGEDIKHIRHAVSFLKPGGRLVALCANGQRQQRELKPLADEWEDLPEGSFSTQGTNVNVALLVIEGPAADRLF
jgi:protein-L-isoaspartate O-methyltransferase